MEEGARFAAVFSLQRWWRDAGKPRCPKSRGCEVQRPFLFQPTFCGPLRCIRERYRVLRVWRTVVRRKCPHNRPRMPGNGLSCIARRSPDCAFIGAADDGNRLLVRRRAVAEAHVHTTEPAGRNFQITSSWFALVHFESFLWVKF